MGFYIMGPKGFDTSFRCRANSAPREQTTLVIRNNTDSRIFGSHFPFRSVSEVLNLDPWQWPP